jgi:DNA-binding LacI/PurR family transcriptional regulator
MGADPTIYDIAKRAGVGIATVSRVLNGSDRVAEPTRQSVQQAMTDLGFRPNRAARRLAVRGPNRARVAAIMPFFSASFYYTVAAPLSAGLTAADMDLVLHNIQQRDDKGRILERIVAERSCEGLVLFSTGISGEQLTELRRVGIPVVSVDYPAADIPSLTVDNVAGATMAAQHLLQAGAKRLGLISGPSSALAFRRREEGFAAVAGAQAPQTRAEAVTIAAGETAAAALLTAHPGLDGLVCVNDVLAVGALQTVRQRGRRVPEDVQIIGFDDQPMMDVIGLTTVRQPMHEFGAWAAKAISTLIARPGAQPSSAAAIASVVLPLAVVARVTTLPIPGRPRSARSTRQE